jgi:hypothetical protein
MLLLTEIVKRSDVSYSNDLAPDRTNQTDPNGEIVKYSDRHQGIRQDCPNDGTSGSNRPTAMIVTRSDFISACGIIRGARRIWRTAPCDKSEGEIRFLRKLVDLLLRVLSGLTARGTAMRVRK